MIDLAGINRVYVDTNVFIYFVEFENSLGDTAREWLDAVTATGRPIVVSRLTLLECIGKPAKDDDQELVQLYRSTLTKSPEIEMVELETHILESAALKGGKLGLKLLDAIHYFTALHLGCDLFLTNDARFRSTPDMRVALIGSSTS